MSVVIRKQIRVVAHLNRTERHKLLAFCELIHIEHHFLGRGKGFLLPAQHRVLLALFSAGVIPVAVFAVRHRRIGLLDVAERLAIELFRKRLFIGGHLLSVCIFCFQVLPYLRIVSLAKPAVIIDQY